MTDKEIVDRAKKAEKSTGFGELVHSPISKGVNSAYGIGFIEGMVEYRNSLQEEPVSEDLIEELKKIVNIRECVSQGVPVIKIARHFANWQKEQMMKGAVKGGCFSYRNGYKHISCDIDEKLTDIKLGDKVKLFIIKED